MKGISHFAVGIATASCCPAAVRAGSDGNPLYFIIAAVFGMLPDTMDFKFYRFLYRHDIEIAPDPNKPDPGMIAEAVASAAARAYQIRKPVRVKLDAIRLGADLWRRYVVRFDVQNRCVTVSCGPEVDTGGRIVRENVDRSPSESVHVPFDIKPDYLAATTVDILDGPVLEMVPEPDGRIGAHFIPWHRKWSHSLVTCAAAAGCAALLWGPLAGMIGACAYGAHILVDQAGYMGSNLFFPFTRKRSTGLRLVRSDNPYANLAAVWISCLVIFWNLYRSQSGLPPCPGMLRWLFYGLGIPALLVLAARRLMPERERPTVSG